MGIINRGGRKLRKRRSDRWTRGNHGLGLSQANVKVELNTAKELSTQSIKSSEMATSYYTIPWRKMVLHSVAASAVYILPLTWKLRSEMRARSNTMASGSKLVVELQGPSHPRKRHLRNHAKTHTHTNKHRHTDPHPHHPTNTTHRIINRMAQTLRNGVDAAFTPSDAANSRGPKPRPPYLLTYLLT